MNMFHRRIVSLFFVAAVWLCGPAFCEAAWPGKDLAGHWRFDSISENQAADLSGGGRPLRIVSPAFASEGDGVRSLRCDGFDTSAVLEEKSPLEFPKGLTVAVWVRPERTRRYEPLLGRPNSNPSWTTPTTGFYFESGRPVFGLFGGKGRMLVEAPSPVPTRAWSLIVGTADGKKLELWIDGKKVAELAQTQPVPKSGGLPWYVGRNAGQGFRGRIGEVAVWSRALTAAEINDLKIATASRYPDTQSSVGKAGRLFNDRTVMVASSGSNPAGTFRERPTRMLEGLDGFVPGEAPPLDRWGGRMDRPARKATGFFRTEKIEGRWWLITPEGHLFWNVGINAVQKPKNIPSSKADAWAVEALKDLRRLGFNGMGNWRADSFQRADDMMPRCLRMNFLSSFAKEHKRTYATSGHTGFVEQCPPVFHPEFVRWARAHAESGASDANDPSAIGIFTDNELQTPVNLLDKHLGLDPNDDYLRHGREAAVAWLQARGRPVDPKQITLRDRMEFIAHFMATYARIVHDAIRLYDKNHLILGPRFNEHASQFENPWFWPAVAPWIDVVAVNYYALWGPQREDIQAWSDSMNRPVMLTEWYAKAADAPGLSNKNGAGWFVRTQEDRALYYQHFMLAALETPSLVGVHYFKYMDDPKESVALDSAGGANKGMYTSTGAPWEALQRRAQAVNTQHYRLIDFFDGREKAAK